MQRDKSSKTLQGKIKEGRRLRGENFWGVAEARGGSRKARTEKGRAAEA